MPDAVTSQTLVDNQTTAIILYTYTLILEMTKYYN